MFGLDRVYCGREEKVESRLLDAAGCGEVGSDSLPRQGCMGLHTEQTTAQSCQAHFVLYDRALHPEHFELQGRRSIRAQTLPDGSVAAPGRACSQI